MSDSAPQPNQSVWLNASAAGECLGFSSAMIRQLCRRKLLTHSKMPGRNSGYRFRVEWLDEFAEARVVRSTITPKVAPVKRQASRLKATESPQEMLTIINKQLKAIG